MTLNKTILIILMILPLDGVFAEVNNHVRDDNKYYYSYLINEKNLDYYIENPVIKEGDYIIMDSIYAAQFLYCKGIFEEAEPPHRIVRCIYNGKAFKRTMYQRKPSKGYKLRWKYLIFFNRVG